MIGLYYTAIIVLNSRVSRIFQKSSSRLEDLPDDVCFQNPFSGYLIWTGWQSCGFRQAIWIGWFSL